MTIKTYFPIFFLLIVSVLQSEAQYDCKTLVPDSVQALYRLDAEQILAREFATTEFKKQNSIEFPQEQIEPILSALLAIYGDSDLPHWEEVIRFYKIHTKETVPVRNIRLIVDTASLWTDLENYSPTNLNSGDSELDQLLSQYQFSHSSAPMYVELIDEPGVFLELNLTAKNSLNLAPFLSRLRKIEGVVSAKSLVISENTGFVQDIFFDKQDAYSEITFQLSWSCEEGICENDHFWIYQVYPDCRASFVRAEGDLLPAQNIPGFISAGVYPNPTSDVFFAQFLAPIEKDIKVVLLSAMGQIIQTDLIQTQSGIIQLNYSLKDLPVGMYFLGLISEGKVLTEKILKK